MTTTIEIPEEIDNLYRPEPLAHLPWFSSIGLWGDVLVGLGIPKTTGGQKVNILHIGPLCDQIKEFLEVQDFIGEVKTLKYTGKEWSELFSKTHYEIRKPGDILMKDLFKEAGIDSEWWFRGHLDADYNCIMNKPYHWSGIKLCQKYWIEASQILERIKISFKGNEKDSNGTRRKIIILQPYSISSSGESDHMSKENWDFALQFLLNFTPHIYILVGTNVESIGEHPRLINLIGKTSSVQTVFALSSMADGVITTSNSLSHYCCIANIRALVIGNKPLKNSDSVFRKFLTCNHIGIVDYDETISRFVKMSAMYGGIK